MHRRQAGKASIACDAGDEKGCFTSASARTLQRDSGAYAELSIGTITAVTTPRAVSLRNVLKGCSVEVSWVVMDPLSRRELMGQEVDLIAAHRAAFGDSPTCQFAGGRLGAE